MRYLLAIILMLAVSVPSARAITSAEYCAEPAEVEFVRLLNEYRAQNGAPPVVMDQFLGAAAEHHAIDMGQRNMLDHNLGDGTDFGQNIINHGWTRGGWLGEVATGSYSEADGALTNLRFSPPHNEILLDPKYQAIGVGRYDDGGATQARYWWIADFSSSSIQKPAVICGAPVNTPVPTSTDSAPPTATQIPTPEPTSTPKKCPTRNPHYPNC